MNSIEERDNLIELLKEALKFYADINSYIPTNLNKLEDRYLTIAEVDGGAQARFALQKADELAATNQKLQDDYDKIMVEGLPVTDEFTNLEEEINKLKNINNIMDDIHDNIKENLDD